MSEMSTNVLEVRNLCKYFPIKAGLFSHVVGHVHAVENVSFTLNVYGSANLKQKVKCMNLLNDLL